MSRDADEAEVDEAQTAESERLEEALTSLRDARRFLLVDDEIQRTFRRLNEGAFEEPTVVALVHRYWSAFTCGWDPRRHARVYLFELLDRPLPTIDGLLSHPEMRPASREIACEFRRIFEYDADPADELEPDVEALWFFFWSAYPEAARKLTADDVRGAKKAWTRRGPRESAKELKKWDFFVDLFDRIGLGRMDGSEPLKPNSLSADWRDWRQLKPVPNSG